MILTAKFKINKPELLKASFKVKEQPKVKAKFTAEFRPAKVSQLENDLNYQTDTQVNEAIQAESTVINTHIDNEVERLEDEIEQSVVDVQGSALIDASRVEQTVTLSSKTFIFEQGISSSVWEITHNLNKKPSVTVVDTADEEQVPDRKVYDGLNKVTLYFLAEFAGKAYLN